MRRIREDEFFFLGTSSFLPGNFFFQVNPKCATFSSTKVGLYQYKGTKEVFPVAYGRTSSSEFCEDVSR